MTNQEPQKPETTEQKQDPQHKPAQHEKDKKDQIQPSRSDEANRAK